MDNPGFSSPVIEGRKGRLFSLKFVVIFLLLLFLIPLVLGGYYVWHLQSGVVTAPTPTPTTIAFPTDTPTPGVSPTPTVPVGTPTPTPKGQTKDAASGLDRATVTVMVENGSGKVGAANAAAQLLKQAGYKVIGTKNADAYDYEDVTISVTSDKKAYLPILQKDIAGQYTIKTTNTTLSPGTADALVIIGK